jgi:hypothetical protein
LKISEEMQKHFKYNVLDHVLDSSILVFFVYYFHKFYSQLGQTYFWADETMHLYVTDLIYKTKSIPAILPAIYGECRWSYQSLFHVLASLTIPFGGISGLKYFNLGLLIIFISAFYAIVRRYYGRFEAGAACLLLSLSFVIVECTVRFMTDLISMVLFFFSFFLLMLALKKGQDKNSTYFAVGSGIATALLLMAKQTGYVVLGFYVLLLIWFAIRKNRDLRTVAVAVGVSIAMSLPYFIWAAYNDVGLVAWLMDKYSGDSWRSKEVREMLKAIEKHESGIVEFAINFYRGNRLIISLSALLPLLHFARVRGRDYPHNIFFLMLLYLTAAMIVYHITYPRHTITLLPLLSFLFAHSLSQIVRNRVVRMAVLALLLAASFHFAWKMPNYRMYWNAPADFRYMTDLINKDTSEGTILTINHLDVAVYTGRSVIWAHIFTKNTPYDLFKTRDYGEFQRLLKKYDISHVFIWRRFIGQDRFSFGHYPTYLIKNCQKLNKQGKLPVMASRGEFMLLKVVD